jgi:hypothetical protein
MVNPMMGQQFGISQNARPSRPSQAAKTDKEIETLRKADYNIMIDNQRKQAMVSLLRLAIVLIVSVTVFYFHWRISQRSEST